jgi:hypothetical protein
MLEVLQLIPEEVDEPSLDVSAHRRFSFKNEMIDATSDVIRLLCRFAPTHLKAVLKCATSWVARSDVAGQVRLRRREARARGGGNDAAADRSWRRAGF